MPTMKEMIEAEKLMRWKVAESQVEDPETAKKRRKKVCEKCLYWSQHTHNCDYILIEGHQRPCAGIRCKELGIYKPGKRKSTARDWSKGKYL